MVGIVVGRDHLLLLQLLLLMLLSLPKSSEGRNGDGGCGLNGDEYFGSFSSILLLSLLSDSTSFEIELLSSFSWFAPSAKEIASSVSLTDFCLSSPIFCTGDGIAFSEGFCSSTSTLICSDFSEVSTCTNLVVVSSSLSRSVWGSSNFVSTSSDWETSFDLGASGSGSVVNIFSESSGDWKDDLCQMYVHVSAWCVFHFHSGEIVCKISYM